MISVLIIEDETAMGETLIKGFTKFGYTPTLINNGIAAQIADPTMYDIVILDWMLPGISGVEVLRSWRQKGYTTPVIMLTARGQTIDKVTGLETGADDYVTKFFDWKELLARVEALLRRTKAANLSWGDITLDPASKQCLVKGMPRKLTKTEYSLLELFLQNPKRIIPKEMILNHIWKDKIEPESNTIERHIYALRKKLHPYDFLETVPLFGYRLRPDTKRTHD